MTDSTQKTWAVAANSGMPAVGGLTVHDVLRELRRRDPDSSRWTASDDGYELFAVEALAGSPAYWARHPGFNRRFVRPRLDGPGPLIAWREAVQALDRDDLTGPAAECRLLRLAASMAAGVPVSLRHTMALGLVSPWDFADAGRWDESAGSG